MTRATARENEQRYRSLLQAFIASKLGETAGTLMKDEPQRAQVIASQAIRIAMEEKAAVLSADTADMLSGVLSASVAKVQFPRVDGIFLGRDADKIGLWDDIRVRVVTLAADGPTNPRR